MRGFRVRAAVAALVGASLCGQAAAASNGCWSPGTISAAKVRDLQTMLMVAALRCHGSGTNVLASYNRFVKSNRTSLMQANTVLKTHFNQSYGKVEGQRRYDRFTTALANAYGAGGAGSSACDEMADLADSASGAGARLAVIAQDRGLDPALPSRACPITIAAK